MSVKDSKPNLSHSQVTEIVMRLYGFTPSLIRPLPSYDDQNFHLAHCEGEEYILKVINSADSQNLTLIELQTQVMTFMYQHELPVQTALPCTTGQLMSLEEIDCGYGNQKYLVRLLTYLPGTPIAKVTCSPQLLYETGKMAAKMDKVLQKMEHPQLSVLERENFIWNLSSIPLLEQYLPLMEGDPTHQVVKDVIEHYKKCVIPKLPFFRKCLNHGDFNDHNILVQQDDSTGYRISGILDFGDMSSGYYIFDLAITIMYMMIENPNPMDVGGPIIAGWESVLPLNEEERDALYLLVLGRFCQSLVLARHAISQQPWNEDYLMITAKTGFRHLHNLWEVGKKEVESTWFQCAAQFSTQSK